MMYKYLQEMEMAYIKLFSEKLEKPYGAMFEDTNQRDKHMHNILFVTNNRITPKEIQDYLDLTEQFGFSNIRFDMMEIPKHIDKKSFQIVPCGYYVSKLDDIHIKPKRQVTLLKVNPEHDTDFYQFIFDDDKQFGLDYAKNNHVRLKEVLMQNQVDFNFYKLMHEGHMIGHINVFYQDQIAKIDDFYVLEPYQRQGFGLAMFYQLLQEIKQRNILEVYLITSELEEAKFLYQQIGMKHIGTYYELKIKTLDLWD